MLIPRQLSFQINLSTHRLSGTQATLPKIKEFCGSRFKDKPLGECMFLIKNNNQGNITLSELKWNLMHDVSYAYVG